MQAVAPGVVYATSKQTCNGRFVVALTAHLASAVTDTAEINQQRMAAIQTELQHYAKHAQAMEKCAEVTGKMAYLNMMSMKLSPACTKWLAKRPDVEFIEVDGEMIINEIDQVGVSSHNQGGVGAVSVGASAAAQVPVAAASVSSTSKISIHAPAPAKPALEPANMQKWRQKHSKPDPRQRRLRRLGRPK